MNGTLAVWYEPEISQLQDFGTQCPQTPELEMHFNLWRDPPSGTDFLDVGFKLSAISNLCRFYMYFPVELTKENLLDLSDVMKFGQTLDAVFNTVVELDAETDSYYTTKCKNEHFVTIHHIDLNTDMMIEAVENESHQKGCVLTFSQALCNRLKCAPSGDQYLRFRIYLNGNAKKTFTEEITARDSLFVTIADKIELTELRLNEQRSYPTSIAKRARSNLFDIYRVHYFLIRDLGHSLVAQHAPLRKVRRLESGLWASYLKGSRVPATGARRERKLASRWIIYHWREVEEAKPIEDFTAFATFKASSPGLFFYLVGIVILGAIGSTVSTWLVKPDNTIRTIFILGLALLIRNPPPSAALF